MAFNWRRVVLKEYGTITAWLTTALLLMILEMLYDSFFTASVRRIQVLAGLIVLVVALWGVARWLKLTKRLRA